MAATRLRCAMRSATTEIRSPLKNADILTRPQSTTKLSESRPCDRAFTALPNSRGSATCRAPDTMPAAVSVAAICFSGARRRRVRSSARRSSEAALRMSGCDAIAGFHTKPEVVCPTYRAHRWLTSRCSGGSDTTNSHCR